MERYQNDLLIQMINKAEPEISESGLVMLDSAWTSYGMCSPYSRLYYVIDGEGWLSWNGKTQKLLPGYFYLIPCGVQVDFGCEKYLKKLYFHVNIYRPDRYDYFSGCKECISFSYPDMEHLQHLYAGNTVIDGMELRQYLFRDILHAMKMLLDGRSQPVLSDLIQQTVDYITGNLSIKLKRDEVAKHFFVSESFLSRKFRDEIGISMGKYIDDHVFFAAQKLLRDTSLSIAEISESLGFCDQFYFSRRFSQRYGEPPQKFRKQTLLP